VVNGAYRIVTELEASPLSFQNVAPAPPSGAHVFCNTTSTPKSAKRNNFIRLYKQNFECRRIYCCSEGSYVPC